MQCPTTVTTASNRPKTQMTPNGSMLGTRQITGRSTYSLLTRARESWFSSPFWENLALLGFANDSRGMRSCFSSDDLLDDIARNIGQAKITAGVAVGQLFVIQAK